MLVPRSRSIRENRFHGSIESIATKNRRSDSRMIEPEMALIVVLIGLLVCSADCSSDRLGVFELTHRYSAAPGSNRSTNGTGVTHEHMQLLKAHDRGRLVKLKSSAVSLPVEGLADPYIAGLYFTPVQLGTPPRTYNLQVDTGSDLLWVNCHPCVGCPAFSDLKIPIIPYDVKASTSSSKVPCSDPSCALITQISESGCNDQNQCGYSFQYGDGSGTLGYLVEDILHYAANATAPVIFGCGIKQSGDLSTSDRALDGIIGFGASDLSFNSQLAKQGKTPNVFAHCLDGGQNGGGILVLGNVIEPDIQYTPLVPYMSHYNVVLQNISVGNTNLTIDPKLFSNDIMQGTIFDSGTTLAYLPDAAYEAFVQAVVDAAHPSPVGVTGNVCFVVHGSSHKNFPTVVLYFDGASMSLTPAEYLIRQASAANAPIWCMGWQSMGSESQLQYTIFGDLVLKNKLVVYDLERGRIGWRPFDCSATVDVSAESGVKTFGGKGTFIRGQASGSKARHSVSLILTAICLVLLCFI